MIRGFRRSLTLLAVSAMAVPLWVTQAESYSPYLDQVRAMHPAEFACNICHDSNHGLTRFGQDFKDALGEGGDPYLALKAIAALDSDGDGVSNGEELDAGSLPQDRFSLPHRP